MKEMLDALSVSRLRKMAKWKWIFLGIAVLLLVVLVAYYAVFISSFSLRLVGTAFPMHSVPREKEGYVYCSQIWLKPESRVPLSFQSVAVFDSRTNEALDATVFLCDAESTNIYGEGRVPMGYIKLHEWSEIIGVASFRPEDFKAESQDIWLFPIFGALPPSGHDARVVVNYKLYDIFPKQEEFILPIS